MRRDKRLLREAGAVEMRAEAAAIGLATGRVPRWSRRHPWLYGLLAFLIGGAVISAFIMTGYKNWAFESIDLTRALHRVVAGGLLGGIISAALGFGYARLTGRA